MFACLSEGATPVCGEAVAVQLQGTLALGGGARLRPAKQLYKELGDHTPNTALAEHTGC